METVTDISPPGDIAHFVGGQNIQVKTYPPPKTDHRSPELPPPKTPDAIPVDLAPLSSALQLVDLTQAPLGYLQEDLKKKEFEVKASMDQLHKEYQSVKTLLDSYRENPALGDPNSLVEELLQIRNKVRMKESDLAMGRGKIALFSVFSAEPQEGDMYAYLENCDASPNVNRPLKTSDVLVGGRSHEFVEDERKFKIPVKCAYCDSVVQAPISRGMKCRVCKCTVHTKCQSYIAYCSGQPPSKGSAKPENHIPVRYANSPKAQKKQKRFSWMQGKKLASESSEGFEDGDDDETMGGLYEAPPSPPPRPSDNSRGVVSPLHAPNPPPRAASLDPKSGNREDDLSHYSFNDTVEYKHCVVLYDYGKVNSNDLEIQAGNVVELINTGSSDWWKGSMHGRSGYFPAAYVQLVSPGDVIMRALYEFSASSSEEASLEEGQIVVMTRCDGDGWMYGKSGDSEGLFPENYVERLCVV